MLEHGGQLRRAARQYGRPLEEWLDLSTGVNPLPWRDITAPESVIACRALRDRPWLQGTRARLRSDGARLAGLLKACGQPSAGGCELFQWRLSKQAPQIHDSLARAGILTRLFESPASVRFGLPGGEKDWQRLEAALRALPTEARG